MKILYLLILGIKNIWSKRMDKKTVAVIGAGGFVGSQIAKAVTDSDCYDLIPVLRHDPADELLNKADIIIHSANPARRFQAENHSMLDFEETVEKTARFFSLSRGKRFILVSSMSCRTQLYTNYGRNRRACELLVLTGNSLVIRLGPMFGGNRKADMLHDILAGRKVYIAAETKYAYVDVAWVGQKIVELIEGPIGLQEIGARNSVCLGDLSRYFKSTSEFSGIIETQIPENFTDGPDANDVYAFAKLEIG